MQAIAENTLTLEEEKEEDDDDDDDVQELGENEDGEGDEKDRARRTELLDADEQLETSRLPLTLLLATVRCSSILAGRPIGERTNCIFSTQ
jgi:hypothetical protein